MGQGNSQFFIRSRLNGKVLDIEGGQARKNARVILWPQKSGNNLNQQWRFEPTANGHFHVVSALDGNLVMDVAGGSSPGVKVLIWEKKYPASPNQMFRKEGEGFASAVAPGLVLDIENGNPNDGAGVILWNRTNARNQQWELIPGTQQGGQPQPQFPQPGFPGFNPQQQQPGYPPQPGFPTRPGFPQQPNYPNYPGQPGYPPQPGFPQGPQNPIFQEPKVPQGNVHIRASNGKVLDVKNGNPAKGSQIIVWDKQNPAKPNQLWRFEPTMNGWYHLVSVLNPKMVMDVKNGQGVPGATLIIWERTTPPSKNQQFQLRGSSLVCQVAPNLVFDIKGDGLQMQLNNQSGQMTQNFQLVPV